MAGILLIAWLEFTKVENLAIVPMCNVHLNVAGFGTYLFLTAVTD